MFHRFTTWWRALSVVLLSLAAVTWPSAAWAVSSPAIAVGFNVVHQNTLTTLSPRGTSHFTTTLSLKGTTTATTATVTLYPPISSLAAMEELGAGVAPGTTPLTSTRAFPLNCRHHGEVTFTVSIFQHAPSNATPSCDGVAPVLRLACTGSNCDGVYPVRYVVRLLGLTLVKWSAIVVRDEKLANPLSVDLVENLDAQAVAHATHTLHVLTEIGHFTSTPITLGVSYSALDTLAYGEVDTSAWHAALDAALTSAEHRVIVAPPGSIDFAGLVANGLTTQVPEQLTLSETLLKSLTGRYVDGPVLLSGSQTSASLLALASAGVNNVVLPEDNLAQAPSSTSAFGVPFHVAGATQLNALSLNGPLDRLISDEAVEPGRRAALTLAMLAYFYFEAPATPATRSVVLAASMGDLSTPFLSDLIHGLSGDPYSQLSALTPSFNPSLVGADGAPAVRALAISPVVSMWSAHNITSLLSLIGSVASFTQGVKSAPVASALRVAVARSEIVGPPDRRQNVIDAASDLLNGQLNQFAIDASSITLAGPGTSIPITVTSRANYPVDAVVHLVTDRLGFPKGSAVPVTIDSPTQSVRVATSSPRGSSLTLQVVLTTPNNQVVLARSAIQVRIAGTSVVGYLLTLASLFVLAWWWWRTNRRRAKGRHAR